MCDCIPYVLPTNFPDFGEEIKNATLCNLTHLKCLARYTSELSFADSNPAIKLKVMLLAGTLYTLRPKQLVRGLEKEFGDSLDCPDCYPLCSLSRYLVQATYSELSAGEITGGSWGIM